MGRLLQELQTNGNLRCQIITRVQCLNNSDSMTIILTEILSEWVARASTSATIEELCRILRNAQLCLIAKEIEDLVVDSNAGIIEDRTVDTTPISDKADKNDTRKPLAGNSN